MNTGRRADAQSKETAFAGLPKSVRAFTPAQGPGGAGAWAALGGFGAGIAWNYGGYIVNNQNIVVPEPGLYLIVVAGVTSNITPGQNFIVASAPLAQGQGGFGGHPMQSFVGMASNGRGGASSVVELKAGDDVALWVWGDAAHSWSGSALCFLELTKLGGQY